MRRRTRSCRIGMALKLERDRPFWLQGQVSHVYVVCSYHLWSSLGSYLRLRTRSNGNRTSMANRGVSQPCSPIQNALRGLREWRNVRVHSSECKSRDRSQLGIHDLCHRDKSRSNHDVPLHRRIEITLPSNVCRYTFLLTCNHSETSPVYPQMRRRPTSTENQVFSGVLGGIERLVPLNIESPIATPSSA